MSSQNFRSSGVAIPDTFLVVLVEPGKCAGCPMYADAILRRSSGRDRVGVLMVPCYRKRDTAFVLQENPVFDKVICLTESNQGFLKSDYDTYVFTREGKVVCRWLLYRTIDRQPMERITTCWPD